jgi:hypothetical protein
MAETLELNETVRQNSRPEVVAWLTDFVTRHGGFVGSVHLPAGDGRLALVAAHNLPPAVQNGAALVVVGKGMAGVTADRKAPIALTDLQTDTSGVARPPALASQSKGSVTLPVLTEDGQTVLAIIGMGFADEREFSDEEIALYAAEVKTVLDITG